MSRYKLQQVLLKGGEWEDTDTLFKTKKDVESYIGESSKVDFEWRVGYTFKQYDSEFMLRIVYNSGKKLGEVLV